MTTVLLSADHFVQILVFRIKSKLWVTCTLSDLVLLFVMLQAGGRAASDTADCSQAGAAGAGAAVGGSAALYQWTDAQQLAAQRPLPTPHGQWMLVQMPNNKW